MSASIDVQHGNSDVSSRFETRPLAGALGAELLDVDLSMPLDNEMIASIRAAWLRYQVIFFRNQTLDNGQFLDFARRFGSTVEYPFVNGIEGYPEIIPVLKLENEASNFGGVWHSDTTYLDQPPMATMLMARELPPYGGDTLFANAYMAYETLSPGLQRMLSGVRAVGSSSKADASRNREDRMRDNGKSGAAQEYTALHPVVRTHPETGRKALYVNFAHTARFDDMTDEESAPLLNYLFQHLTKPEFTCRFVWQPGSIALWDNRCVQHNAINDYHGYRRLMHRITLQGDIPS